MFLYNERKHDTVSLSHFCTRRNQKHSYYWAQGVQ